MWSLQRWQASYPFCPCDTRDPRRRFPFNSRGRTHRLAQSFLNEGSMNFRIFFCHSIDHWIKSPGSSSLHLPTVDRHETDSVAPDEGWLEIAGPMLFICYCCGLKFVCRAVYRPLFSLMHLSWNRFPSNNSPSSVDNLLSGFRWLLSFYLLLLRSVYDSS